MQAQPAKGGSVGMSDTCTHMHAQAYTCPHTHLLQKCVQNGALRCHVLLLQGLPEVLQGDVGMVGPQVGVKTPFGYLNMLIYQGEQLVTLWGQNETKMGIRKFH